MIIFNGRILLIRPKLYLANSGNYRESRWFSCWQRRQQIESHPLPESIQLITGQTSVPFGDAVINTMDTSVGFEVCEELFTADSPHNSMGLDGVEIFSNGSSSHYQAGKLKRRLELVNGATARTGGIYLYANQHGTDGEGQIYYDGCPLISANGKLVGQGQQFPLTDVQVTAAKIDLDDLRTFRGLTQSLGNQGAAYEQSYPQISVHFNLSKQCLLDASDDPIYPRLYSTEQELALGAACWLWDYLRKSGAGGFFLALSGGADSTSCALIVHSLANLLFDHGHGNEEVRIQIQQVLNIDMSLVQSPKDLMKQLLHTAFLSTEQNSAETRKRSEELASVIGSNHLSVPIDTIVNASVSVVSTLLSFCPRFKIYGGSDRESIALQNLQARLRMVMSYFCAQLIPLTQTNQKTLLVLGTGNADEGLRGYFSKYDNSSGDLNPIGSVNKEDLSSFIRYMHGTYHLLQPILTEVLDAAPTAELEPGHAQTDEQDMGMTYSELAEYQNFRGRLKAGPFSLFTKLAAIWTRTRGLSLTEIAAKVKLFFTMYSANRHKILTITPAFHAHAYNVDDHRYDQRPYLYRRDWSWQFAKIDEAVQTKHICNEI